jgi:hypothetical protein
MEIQPKSARINEAAGLRVNHVGGSAGRPLLAEGDCDDEHRHEQQA